MYAVIGMYTHAHAHTHTHTIDNTRLKELATLIVIICLFWLCASLDNMPTYPDKYICYLARWLAEAANNSYLLDNDCYLHFVLHYSNTDLRKIG